MRIGSLLGQPGRAQAGALAAFHDTLLPKLVSGELLVLDAERFVVEAL